MSLQSGAYLDFLFQAFDVWTRCSIPDTFDSMFTSTASGDAGGSKVRLFFRSDSG